MEALWSRNSQLEGRSRFEWHHQLGAHRTGELALLMTLGVLAAILTCIAASPIRLPGHAILRGTLPMILGLSLAPRHAAGALMSAAAACVFAIAALFGLQQAPLAAVVAIIALGPALDLATARLPAAGWRLYARFAAAGLIANLAAFAVRFAIGPAATQRMPGAGIFQSWPFALASFAAFGAVAGLLCGVLWFRSHPRDTDEAA